MSNQSSPDLHNRGWGFALFIIILAIGTNIGVYMIHKATYLAPPSSAAVAAEHK